MWQAIKNTVLWNYRRTAWQYDVLCILILAFIFLTPKSWFEGKGREPLSSETSKLTRLVVTSDNFSPDSDEATKLRRVRELSGNENASIAAWHERRDAVSGKTVYEIDLR